MGQVIISPNLKRTSVRIDAGGNIIDPQTKAVIQKKPDESVAPLPEKEVAPETKSTLSIQEQLEAAQKLVLDLQKAKKKQIADLKKQVEELEKS